MGRKLWSAAALAVVLAACNAREVEGQKVTGDVDCARCHGGGDNRTGAPPRDAHGNTETTATGVGAHTAHVTGPHHVAPAFGCEACHQAPDPQNLGAHVNGSTVLSFGVLASAGGVTPAFERDNAAGPTCTVYCHGASLAGGQDPAPVWTLVNGAQADCGSCHGVPPPAPHPQRSDCARCHPDSLADGFPAAATANHLNGQVDLAGGCATCHGNADRVTSVELVKAAPPVGVDGETATTARAVGAHEAHLLAGTVAQPVPCETCHAVPTEQTHSDGVVELRFAGVAVAQGVEAALGGTDPANPTCTTYCHGATLAGGTVPQPIWTKVDGTQAACGACHGAPPATVRGGAAPHPSGERCGICHPGTVNLETNALRVSNGLHVNGTVDVQKYHPDGWAARTSHGYAANEDLAGCKDCHGADFGGGGTGVSCNACHASNGQAGWQTDCTFCHGDGNRAAFRPAPPVGTQGEVAASTRAVGAHQKHLAGGTVRQGVACTECHAVPADLSHVTGTVDLAFGALARTGGATPALAPDTTCSSTYCHGATLAIGGGTNTTPLWTGGAAEAACGACHGLPPPRPHVQLSMCSACHRETVLSGTTIDLAGGKHVDGLVQAQPFHPAGWVAPAVHGLAANEGLDGCRSCHGADLAGGGSGVSCATCHGATWQSNCTFCHGERVGTYTPADLPRAAPPQGTANETATTERAVGAHARHLQGGAVSNPFACSECHAVPADLAHVNGAPALAFGPIANADAFASSFAGGTCATYCHGATLGGGTDKSPAWTTVNGTQAACGTCHGLPPPPPHSPNPSCGSCHDGYGTATAPSVNKALHVNGTTDVKPFTCASCHGDPARTGSDLLKAAPPVSTTGATAATARGVGAHQAHLQGGALSRPLACTECHLPPSSMAHSDLTVQLTWGALATGGGATAPSFAGGTATCSSTYCHGATLAAGGTRTAPVWTGGAAEVACGACHGAPPPAPHPQNPNCGGCHGAGYGPAAVNALTHVDGHLDLVPFTCASCHGDAARPGTDLVKAAPPAGSAGETASSTLAVGAHAAHVFAPTLTNGYACSECHVVPPAGDVGPPALHADGTVAMAFGPIANDGTTTVWNRGAATCSASYCHGAFPGGQLTNAPNWTLGDSQAACGSCHGAPPATTTTGGPHSQKPVCGDCHTGFGPGTVDRAVHANGVVDVTLTCFSCHGDSARPGTAERKAAPPTGANGETATTSLAVGAHERHLSGGPLFGPIACAECHAVPTTMNHPDGTAEVRFGALGTRGAATEPYTPGWNHGTATCTTYCHGATLSGGTRPTPVWTGGAAEAACGTCHGAPPPTIASGGAHSRNPNCGGCHGGYTATSVNLSTHLDGDVDVSEMTCSSCHGDSSRVGSELEKAAPPAGAGGETLTTDLAVGAHQAHLGAGGLGRAVACADCHASVPTSTGHPDGTAQIQWGGLATHGGAAPTWNRATGTCSNTYCHGNYQGTFTYTRWDYGSETLETVTYDYAGSNATPSWTAAAACGSCHGRPPAGSWHGTHGGGNQCELCHPDASGQPAAAAITNPALHVNGTIEVTPEWKTSCFGCH